MLILPSVLADALSDVRVTVNLTVYFPGSA
jgi:hypothetical protein